MTSPRVWHSPASAAVYADASVDTIGDALRSGDLLGYQRVAGGKWRIHVTDLDAWIKGEPPVTARRAS